MDQATSSLLSWIAQRASEPSTWVSLGSLITGVGFTIAPQYWSQIAAIGMGIGGLLGVILKERKKTTSDEIKAVVEKTVTPEALK
jgi:hypothetical protein